MTGGEISGNTGGGGAGVCITGSGVFMMTGGKISGNTVSQYGGGVYVSSGGGSTITGGSFTMTGGEISGNTATKYGGGVYVSGTLSKGEMTFTMTGGKISGNRAGTTGDGAYLSSGTFTMTGGEISGNNAGDGAGVYLGRGLLNLSGAAVISGDNSVVFSATYNKITVTGSFTGSVGSFQPMPTSGVCVKTSGTVTASDILSRFALTSDAGKTPNRFTHHLTASSTTELSLVANPVPVVAAARSSPTTATFTITTAYGDGVAPVLSYWTDTAKKYTATAIATGTANQWTVTVSGLAANTAYSYQVTYSGLTTTGTLSAAASAPYTITITSPAASATGVSTSPLVIWTISNIDEAITAIDPVITFTSVAKGTVSGTTPTKIDGTTRTMQTALTGLAPNTQYTVSIAYGGSTQTVSFTTAPADVVTVFSFQELSDAISGTSGAKTIIIGRNIDIGATALPEITSGKDITLVPADTGSYTIKRTVAGIGRFTVNGGKLTLGKSSGTGTLTIDGNSGLVNTASVLVYVMNGGTFTLADGILSGSNGGGVYAIGSTFTMTGGEISGNTGGDGGGVYINGCTFLMTGGKISGNTGTGGAGVYIRNGGIFTMTGGEISGNAAPSSGSGGGGVFVFTGRFTMTGGKISGNKADICDGVLVRSGGIFTMTGGEISGNTAGDGVGVHIMDGTFNLGGTAVISEDNSVIIPTGKPIIVTGMFTGSVKNLRPQFTSGTCVNVTPGTVTAGSILSRFALTPDTGKTPNRVTYHLAASGTTNDLIVVKNPDPVVAAVRSSPTTATFTITTAYGDGVAPVLSYWTDSAKKYTATAIATGTANQWTVTVSGLAANTAYSYQVTYSGLTTADTLSAAASAPYTITITSPAASATGVSTSPVVTWTINNIDAAITAIDPVITFTSAAKGTVSGTTPTKIDGTTRTMQTALTGLAPNTQYTVSIAYGGSTKTVSFTTAAVSISTPTLVTGTASSITVQFTALGVDPGTVGIHYGTSPTRDTNSRYASAVITDAATGTYRATAMDLEQNTTYYIWAKSAGTYSTGFFQGSPSNYDIHSLYVDTATITQTSAQITVLLLNAGVGASPIILYNTRDDINSSIRVPTVPDTASGTSFRASLTGLTPGTTYYYWGEYNGLFVGGTIPAVKTFTTAAAAVPVITITSPAASATGISTSPAVTWTITNIPVGTTAIDPVITFTSTAKGTVSGTTRTAVSGTTWTMQTALTGLVPNTQYTVSIAYGTAAAKTVSFTTAVVSLSTPTKVATTPDSVTVQFQASGNLIGVPGIRYGTSSSRDSNEGYVEAVMTNVLADTYRATISGLDQGVNYYFWSTSAGTYSSGSLQASPTIYSLSDLAASAIMQTGAKITFNLANVESGAAPKVLYNTVNDASSARSVPASRVGQTGTGYTVALTDLSPGANYFVWAEYNGAYIGGGTKLFTTLAAAVPVISITSPAASATGISTSPVVTWTITNIPAGTTAIDPVITFTSTAKGTVSGTTKTAVSGTTWTMQTALTDLAPSTQYTVSIAYGGSTQTVSFTTAAAAAADVVTVSSFQELSDAISGTSGAKTIIIGNNIDIGATSLPSITSGKDITLVPADTGSYTIKRTVRQILLFTVTGGNLTLGKSSGTGTLTIDGNSSLGSFSNNYLVSVTGGTFILADGKLTGASCSSGIGGCVYVAGGTFTMTGGEISGNTGGGGAGVCITGSGVFMMTGGKISGNTVSQYGGGVYVSSGGGSTITGGSFTMTGGSQL